MFRFLHVFQRWIKPVVAEFVATFILLFWACMLQGRFKSRLPCEVIFESDKPIVYHMETHFENLQSRNQAHRTLNQFHIK